MTRIKSRLALLLTISLGLALLIFAAWMVALPLGTTTAQEDEDEAPASEAESTTEGESEAMSEFIVSGDSSYCLVCHDLSGTVPQIDWAQLSENSNVHNLASLAHSTHVGHEAIGCLDCHADDTFPHIGNRDLGDFMSVAENYTDSCIGCHQHSDLDIEGGCDACHGEVYEVPRDAAVLDIGLDKCQACHADTIAEWQTSKHGTQQLACDSCHYVHQEELRFGTVQALCLNCHDQPRTDFAHVIHVDQACSDCHVYHGETQTLHVISGGNVINTGHDNHVQPEACISCHQEGVEIASADDPLNIENHPIIKSREQIEALEEEAADVEDETTREAALRFAQSLIIGLALGVFGTLTLERIRKRSHTISAGDEEHNG